MTAQYFVLKRIPTGDTKVRIEEALADLGYSPRRGRWPVCHKCGGTDFEWNANTKLHYCSVCNANYDAHGKKQSPPKADPTILREDYFIILKSHPDRPYSRVPCSKCGHTEFTKIGDYGLYCSKCSTPSPISVDYLKQRDEAKKERDQAQRSSDDYEQRWHSARKQRDEARANCNTLKEMVAKLSAELDARPSKLPCLNCSSMDYVWCFDNGESAYCSKCSPDTPPPPKPLLKFLPCPGCNRLLTTLSEHLPPGRCCICGAELSPPVCPHCGHDTFEPVRPFTFGTFNADGTLALPGLYFFCCAKCGKEAGTLPLKRVSSKTSK